MTSNPSIAICIAGWHYGPDFYAHIANLNLAQIFVISHKQPDEVPDYVFKYFQKEQFFFESNYGYDWGCYQQFLAKGLWRHFDYIFFIHDDITITDDGFIEACISLLNAGHSVIGNGRVAPKNAWPNLVPQAYAHAVWKPPNRAFRHDVVRGSFFATSRADLEKLGAFEVYWDPYHLSSNFGNWSTRASCARWEYFCGENCFQFLSENYCESDYIVESIRGGQGITEIDSPIRKAAIHLIRSSFNLYMTMHWREHSALAKTILLKLMTPYVRRVSGSF